jgi:hypothetical protein
MKRYNWQILLGLSLIFLSAILYFAHYAIFRDAHHIFIYLIGDIAFVPIEVLLVTLIIQRVLSAREKRSRLKKLNMVIGAFFSEVGTSLLKALSDLDPNPEKMKGDLIIKSNWSHKEFSLMSKRLKGYNYEIDSQKGDLEELKKFLTGKREFLLGLLENPNLLEHESFTDLLWAVFHLMEELDFRKEVNRLSKGDHGHLSNDIKRAYRLLVHEWLVYMKHLKDNYPYLFSLAIRTNPFDPNASVEIT